MPCCAGISAYRPAGPAWLERRTPTQDTPFCFAIAIASSAARDITRWPMPLSPSTRAVAGAERVTVMSGCLLKPPAFRRRIYCGSRKMPWPSAPVRSASVISAAHFSASALGRPAATKASPISACVARDGTLIRSALLMMRVPYAITRFLARIFAAWLCRIFSRCASVISRPRTCRTQSSMPMS